MADTLKKFLDQDAFKQLVTEVKTADAAVLAAAKAHCDGKDKLYDTVGAAATAESNAKAYTDEKVAPLATTAALNAVDGKVATETSERKAADETLQSNIDATNAKADKNAEDIAALSKTHSDDKALLDAKDAELEGAISDLDAKVGDIPVVEGQETPATVIEYINKKTEGIATDAALGQLQSDLDAVEADVATIKGDYLTSTDKEELATDIEEVQGAVDELAQTHATDKTALEGAIALKADQTALDAVSGVANAAVKQSVYDEKVAALDEEDARIAGLVEAEAETARAAEKANADAIAAIKEDVDAFFKDADMTETAKETLKDIQGYISEHTAEAGEMTAAIQKNKEDIAAHVATDHDFAGADAALKAELEGKIGEKADSTTVDGISGKVTVLEGEMDTVEGKVSTLEGEMDAVEAAVAKKLDEQMFMMAVESLAGQDVELFDRVAALEAKHGDGEGTVESLIADAKQEAIEVAATDATTKANTAESNAKAHADGLNTAMNTRVEKLEADSATHALASDVTALAERVTTAEGEIDTLQGEMDVVEGKVAANEEAITAINTELDEKALQSDLDAAVARISANETAIATKASQDELDDAVEDIAKNTTDIATANANISANAAAIAAFSPYTAAEVTALWNSVTV